MSTYLVMDLITHETFPADTIQDVVEAFDFITSAEAWDEEVITDVLHELAYADAFNEWPVRDDHVGILVERRS